MLLRWYRVKKAAELLDRVKPGWRSLVDAERLDLESCRDCVLGQAFAEEAAKVDWAGFFFAIKTYPALDRAAWQTGVFTDPSYQKAWTRLLRRSS